LGGTSGANWDHIEHWLAQDGLILSFAFHDGVEIGPQMMARIAKKTGLTPDDL